MRLMSGNSYFTIDELAEKLETSYRSIYRYIDTFKEVGFAVEKIHGNVYRLVKMPSPFKDISKLVYFSDEEAKILCSLIENLDSTPCTRSSRPSTTSPASRSSPGRNPTRAASRRSETRWRRRGRSY